LAIEGEFIKKKGKKVILKIKGEERECRTAVPGLKKGDKVLVHAGYVIDFVKKA